MYYSNLSLKGVARFKIVVKVTLNPFHNWLPMAIERFVIVNLATRTSCRIPFHEASHLFYMR